MPEAWLPDRCHGPLVADRGGRLDLLPRLLATRCAVVPDNHRAVSQRYRRLRRRSAGVAGEDAVSCFAGHPALAPGRVVHSRSPGSIASEKSPVLWAVLFP